MTLSIPVENTRIVCYFVLIPGKQLTVEKSIDFRFNKLVFSA
jgi:hypothetical protein